MSLGETDDWAHAGNYAEYLNAAHRVDAFLQLLWETVQGMPSYQGRTTLIFSPDHSRGEAPLEWNNHGKKIPDSKYIWLAFLGPDTRGSGERSHVLAVTQISSRRRWLRCSVKTTTLMFTERASLSRMCSRDSRTGTKTGDILFVIQD